MNRIKNLREKIIKYCFMKFNAYHWFFQIHHPKKRTVTLEKFQISSVFKLLTVTAAKKITAKNNFCIFVKFVIVFKFQF